MLNLPNSNKKTINIDFLKSKKNHDFLKLNVTFDLLSSACKILKNNLEFKVNDHEIIKIFSNFYNFDNLNTINVIHKYIKECFIFLEQLEFIKINDNKIQVLKFDIIDLLANPAESLIFLKELAINFKDTNLLSISLSKILHFFSNSKFNNKYINFYELFNNEFVFEFENLETSNKPLSIINFLKSFKVINDITNEEKITKLIQKKKCGYIGFDPTAESLHLGNYVMINIINRLSSAGLKIYPIVGGATGMIGDPSGKSSERTLLNENTILNNKQKIIKQLKTYTNQNEVLDNYDNFKNMLFLSFLRDVGKHINLNYMLEKDIIKSRITTGISFTEFSYTIMQGYDFLCFYKNKNISLQIGGSDQWGNITTGIEMIRKMYSENNTASGLTINLLTKSDGTKFGKSEKGAIFLDKSLTSPYEMYQFLINQADEDIVKLLLFLTNINEYQINIIKELMQSQELLKFRLSQSILSYILISNIHSDDEYQRIIRINNSLFNGLINELDLNDLDIVFNIIPNYTLQKNNKYELYDFLVKTNICKSNRESREIINSNSISVNGIKINDISFELSLDNSLYNKYIIVKKGKKNYFIIKWE